MSSYESAFFIVPRRIINLPGITLAFLRFYETIFQFWNHGKSCYLSNEMIKERTGISSISTIMEAFAFFERHNEMKRKNVGSRRYIVQPERLIEIEEQKPLVDNHKNDCTKTSQGIAVPIGGYRCTDSKGIAVPIHNNKNVNNKNINKNTCAIDQEKNFMSFYDAYPKKRNKQDAIKAWKKIDQSLLPLILDDIHNRVKNDINWQTKKYMPDPASYLNGKRWEDEIIYKSYHKEVKNNASHKETSTARLNRLVGLPTKIATEDNGSTITLDQDSFCQI